MRDHETRLLGPVFVLIMQKLSSICTHSYLISVHQQGGYFLTFPKKCWLLMSSDCFL